MKNLHVESQHLQIVQQVLKKHLPPHSTVWLFGSRATGTAKKFSDLDLLINAGSPLSIGIIANLANDFEESDLPYKVDLVDELTISESFRQHIQQDKVLLWENKL